MSQPKENCLVSILKKIDIFSVGVGFNIRQEEEFGTILGGLVFIVYLVACVYFILFNFFDFASRSTFNQNIIETQIDYAPPINLLNKKFGFALGITVDGSPILDKGDNFFDYVTFNMRHIYKVNATKTKKNINYTSCTKELFSNSIDESFDLSSLQDYACFDPLKNGDSLIIQGIYTEPVFQYLEIEIAVSNAGMSKTDYLYEYFLDHEVKLQFYYLDSAISVSNYSHPEKYI